MSKTLLSLTYKTINTLVSPPEAKFSSQQEIWLSLNKTGKNLAQNWLKTGNNWTRYPDGFTMNPLLQRPLTPLKSTAWGGCFVISHPPELGSQGQGSGLRRVAIPLLLVVSLFLSPRPLFLVIPERQN